MKKEIPILFSTPMVQAILDGRKTHTRRLPGLDEINKNPDEWNFLFVIHPSYKQKPQPVFRFKNIITKDLLDVQCPYGQPGDLLWVREKWTQNGLDYFRYAADWDDEKYGTGEPKGTFIGKAVPEKFRGKWKPSIHMPKNAARIWLEVTNVRVERLQDISEEDAKAEGVERWIEERMKSKPTHYKVYCDLENPTDPAMYSSSAKYSFETLWHLINGLESWEANPWVWVIEFKVLSITGKPTI